MLAPTSPRPSRRTPLGSRLARVLLAGAGLVGAAAMIGLLAGSVALTPAELWRALTTPEGEGPAPTILREIRLPRVLLGGLVGAGLAVAGAAFQGILRNPLADPYLVGTSSGAALGAALALVLRLDAPWAGLSPTLLLAFLGALAALGAVHSLARVGSTLPVETFLLAGVVVGSFCGAMVSFLLTLSGQDMPRILAWLMGSLGQADLPRAGLVLITLSIGGGGLWALSGALNLLTLGEEAALGLGVEVERVKRQVILAASLITAAAVSTSGLIGFVGLVVPHLARMGLGPDHRVLLPASGLGGAAFLILADAAARAVVAPRELPVGVVTALVGAPFFFWLLRRRGGAR